MAIVPATTRWRHGSGTSVGGTRCTSRSVASRSFSASWQQERFEPLDGCGQLVLLYRAGWVHVLGTNLGALAHEGTSPNALMLGKDVHALMRALVTRIHVVALGQGDSRGADKYRIETVNRTRGVAQHAIDAHAELFVAIELVRGLEVFSLGRRPLFFADQPGLDTLQLGHEVGVLYDQVADDGKVAQRLYAPGSAVL